MTKMEKILQDQQEIWIEHEIFVKKEIIEELRLRRNLSDENNNDVIYIIGH